MATYPVHHQPVVEVRQEGALRQDAAKALTYSILDKVKECVASTNYSDGAKAEILETIDILKEKFTYEKNGGDSRQRIVSLQQIFESVIASTLAPEETLRVFFHTPFPVTPLCTESQDPNLSQIVAESLRANNNNILTVQNRTESLRNILALKNAKVYVIYSKGGLQQRQEGQRVIYNNVKEKHKETLEDFELKGEVDQVFCGATYFVGSTEGEICIDIIATQADQPTAEKWGVYCGPIDHPRIQDRIKGIFEHVKKQGGPDLDKELEKAGIKV